MHILHKNDNNHRFILRAIWLFCMYLCVFLCLWLSGYENEFKMMDSRVLLMHACASLATLVKGITCHAKLF